MKKNVLSLVLVVTMFSCNSVKNTTSTSSITNAVTLLGSLSSNSTVEQITSLFNLLDSNKDNAISTTEAKGTVEENFSTLDTDNNSSLNLTELTGLLGLLK